MRVEKLNGNPASDVSTCSQTMWVGVFPLRLIQCSNLCPTYGGSLDAPTVAVPVLHSEHRDTTVHMLDRPAAVDVLTVY